MTTSPRRSSQSPVAARHQPASSFGVTRCFRVHAPGMLNAAVEGSQLSLKAVSRSRSGLTGRDDLGIEFTARHQRRRKTSPGASQSRPCAVAAYREDEAVIDRVIIAQPASCAAGTPGVATGVVSPSRFTVTMSSPPLKAMVAALKHAVGSSPPISTGRRDITGS